MAGITQINWKQLRKTTLPADTALFIGAKTIGWDRISTTLDISDTEIGYLNDLTGNVQNALDARFLNSNFKKIAGLPNNSSLWTNSTDGDIIAASAYAIDQRIAYSISAASIGNSVFKGGWSTSPATPDTSTNKIKQGWSYVYDSGTAPTGATLEVGDYLIAAVDITTPALKAAVSSWVIVQTNINGAVTAASTLTSGAIVLGGGNHSVSTYTGTSHLLATSGGVLATATDADVLAVKPSYPNLIAVNGTSYDLTTADRISITSSTSGTTTGSLVYTTGTKTLNIAFPKVPAETPITVTNGTAETDKYISQITSSAHTLTVTKASLPVVPIFIQEPNLTVTSSTITLSHTPTTSTALAVYLNGMLLTPTNDYTISDKTITLVTYTTVDTGDVFSAIYTY